MFLFLRALFLILFLRQILNRQIQIYKTVHVKCFAHMGSRRDPTGILTGSDAISWDPPLLARNFAWEGRYFSVGSVVPTCPLYNITKRKFSAKTQDSNDARSVAHVLEFYLAAMFLEFYFDCALAVATFNVLKRNRSSQQVLEFCFLGPAVAVAS